MYYTDNPEWDAERYYCDQEKRRLREEDDDRGDLAWAKLQEMTWKEFLEME